MRILVPAYIYLDAKGRAEWDKIFNASLRVPIVAIVNTPSSGPGDEPLSNFSELFERAERSRATLIGYVDTSYTRRSLQDVKNDIDRWIRLYPDVQGIFLDQQASGKQHVYYYRELYTYIRTICDLKLVVANPGTICDENYFSLQTSDVFCLHEDHKVVNGSFPPSWAVRYPTTDVLVLQYGVKTAEEMKTCIDLAVRQKVGYVYITDREGSNPWDNLPAYWKEEVDAVQKMDDAAIK